MSGECEFTITEEDLAAGNRLHARQLWNRRVVLRLWLLLTIALILLAFGVWGRLDLKMLSAPVAAAAYMALGAIVSQLLFSRAGRRSFRQARSFWRPATVKWDDDAVQFASDRGQVRDEWISYFAWAADDRSILLYQSAGLFITLPTRDLGDKMKNDIVLALRNSGVAVRSSL